MGRGQGGGGRGGGGGGFGGPGSELEAIRLEKSAFLSSSEGSLSFKDPTSRAYNSAGRRLIREAAAKREALDRRFQDALKRSGVLR